MTLDEKDLLAIKGLIEFSNEQSEQRMERKINEAVKGSEERIVTRINREITNIAETNRAVLAKMDNHENRIGRLETKTGLKTT